MNFTFIIKTIVMIILILKVMEMMISIITFVIIMMMMTIMVVMVVVVMVMMMKMMKMTIFEDGDCGKSKLDEYGKKRLETLKFRSVSPLVCFGQSKHQLSGSSQRRQQHLAVQPVCPT